MFKVLFSFFLSFTIAVSAQTTVNGNVKLNQAVVVPPSVVSGMVVPTNSTAYKVRLTDNFTGVLAPGLTGGQLFTFISCQPSSSVNYTVNLSPIVGNLFTSTKGCSSTILSWDSDSSVWMAFPSLTLVPGPTGATGSKGDTGAKGDVGNTGQAGPIGPQGATGNVGQTGATGIQGVAGVKGDTGTMGGVGATGPQGVAGNTGATGPQGNAGQTGAIGPTGATGANGLPGGIGPSGSQGNVGATGPQGAAGSPGYISGVTTAVSQGVLTVGSVATGTANITNVVVGTPCEASPANGLANNSLGIKAWGTAVGVATVYQTNLFVLTVAPTATIYNVRCFP